MTEVIDGDALLAKIDPQLPRTEAFVCLRPDLMLEWERAQAELVDTETSSSTGRLAGKKDSGTDSKKQAKVVQSLEDQIREATTRFEFESLDTEAFQALIVHHPPREGDQYDYMVGYNRDSVNDELVRVCLVNMKFTEDGWVALRKKCAPSEWQELRDKAMKANGERVSPPKSVLASQILGRSNVASK